jgi:hypothetical protein
MRETTGKAQRMYSHVLKQMQGRIRTRQYVMTLHAEEEWMMMGFPFLTSSGRF